MAQNKNKFTYNDIRVEQRTKKNGETWWAYRNTNTGRYTKKPEEDDPSPKFTDALMRAEHEGSIHTRPDMGFQEFVIDVQAWGNSGRSIHVYPTQEQKDTLFHFWVEKH